MNVNQIGSVSPKYPNALAVEPSEETHGIERREGARINNATAKALAEASPTTMIQALQIFARDLQRDSSESAILRKKQAVEEAKKQIQEAMNRAQQEANEKSTWGRRTEVLGTIAKAAAVTAAVASIALTGGVSAPLLIGLAGTLLSVTARPVNQALGGGEKLEKALTYGGAAMSLTAGGAGLFCSSAAATGAVATAGHAVSAGAHAIGGAATAASGYTGYKAGEHGARATEARADEKQTTAIRQQLLREVEQLIAMLQEVEQSFTKSIAVVQSARDSEAAANLTLAAGVRG
ncbi:MAG: hypothetical protein RMJ98_13780 [Myxococcales bacterium]|nr:hypothetical protein [Polyangiaceae bacterium]MDW8250361.1 hypothetical protein [Myxococcales bacterium]